MDTENATTQTQNRPETDTPIGAECREISISAMQQAFDRCTTWAKVRLVGIAAAAALLDVERRHLDALRAALAASLEPGAAHDRDVPADPEDNNLTINDLIRYVRRYDRKAEIDALEAGLATVRVYFVETITDNLDRWGSLADWSALNTAVCAAAPGADCDDPEVGLHDRIHAALNRHGSWESAVPALRAAALVVLDAETRENEVARTAALDGLATADTGALAPRREQRGADVVYCLLMGRDPGERVKAWGATDREAIDEVREVLVSACTLDGAEMRDEDLDLLEKVTEAVEARTPKPGAWVQGAEHGAEGRA